MARPKKETVDYFPHFVTSGKTLFILESNFGNDGYAFWFKLLELLGQTKKHYYDCNNTPAWRFLLAKTRVSEVSATEMLNILAELDAIDKELWKNRIIWSQNFVNNIEDSYKKRKAAVPKKPLIPKTDSFCDRNPSADGVSIDEKPQIKVNDIKLNESKVVVKERTESIAKIIDFYCESIGKLNTNATANDFQTAKEFLESGIPVEIIIEGIRQSVTNAKSKVYSLKYCEGKVKDLWEIEKVKQSGIVVKASDKKPTKRTFNNFKGRTYDTKKLEEALLARTRKETITDEEFEKLREERKSK